MNSSRLGFVLAAMAAATLVIATAKTAGGGGADKQDHRHKTEHVLLLSVDGLHATDLADYVKTHPASALAQLSGHGVTYQQASASKPSDSFPACSRWSRGGSPAVTGVYYDDSYDRLLLPPNIDADGNRSAAPRPARKSSTTRPSTST
jgi:hypothetical protein